MRLCKEGMFVVNLPYLYEIYGFEVGGFKNIL